MKRSCTTCLWWPTDDKYQVCRNPDAYGSDPNDPEYWCSKWEPRDRSLVRCETCEWYEDGKCHRHLIKEIVDTTNGLNGAIVYRGFRCSNWRLREERDDG